MLEWLRYLEVLFVCKLPDLPRFGPYFRRVCRLRAWVISLGSLRTVGHVVTIHRGFRFSRKIELVLDDHCTIKEDVTIGGSYFRMGEGSVILCQTVIDASGGVTVGRGTHIGRKNEIYSHKHITNKKSVPVLKAPVVVAPVAIGDDVMLYSNVKVMAGVTIGTGSVVANSTVVTKNLDEYGVYGGIPARKIAERT